jgi:hypothetical protein
LGGNVSNIRLADRKYTFFNDDFLLAFFALQKVDVDSIYAGGSAFGEHIESAAQDVGAVFHRFFGGCDAVKETTLTVEST